MAWNRRRNSNEPTPARAFMGSNESNVIATIRNMAREQRHMAVRDIAVEDFRQLFVPAMYRDHVRIAYGLTAPQYLDQTLEVEVPAKFIPGRLIDKQRLVAEFKWDYDTCPEGFYVQRDSRPTLQSDAPAELLEKIEYVWENLGRISYEFGLVLKVFEELNTHGFCNTPQQMRYVWPAIRHIVDKAGLKYDLIEASARAGDRARVPAIIKEFLVPTVNIVNRTLLMDKVNLQEKREFRLGVNTPEYVVDTSINLEQVSFSGVN